jgi:hypothetical protein
MSLSMSEMAELPGIRVVSDAAAGRLEDSGGHVSMKRPGYPRTAGGVLLAIVSIYVLTGEAGMTSGFAAPVFQGDPQAAGEVQAAFAKLLAAPSWRAKVTTSNGHTQTLEHVAPNRFHSLPPPGVAGAPEMYMIGGDFWLINQGKCQKLPNSVPFMNPRQAVEKSQDAKITVAREGPETVDGTPTMTYSLTVDSRGTTTREKVYVALGTGLLRRLVVLSAQGSTTIDYVDVGAPIAIKPPC